MAAFSAMVLSIASINPGIAYAGTKEDNSAIEQANPNAAYVYSTNVEDTNEYILENINKDLAGSEKLEPADVTVLKQTMAVKDKLPEGGYNLKTMFQSEDSKYANAFVGTNQSYVYLYNTDDNSDYYVAYVNTMNNDSRTVVTDYSFTYNNLYGEVVDDCIYDADTGLAYIPKKYTKENRNGFGIGNIQVQLMQLVNSYNPTVSVNVVVDAKGVNGSVAKSGKASVNALLSTTEIILAEDSRSRADIKSEWISVYINDNQISSFEYNESTGILKVGSAPTAIDSLKVVIEKPGVLSILYDNTLGLLLNPVTVYAKVGGDYSTNGSDWVEGSAPWTFSKMPQIGDSVELTDVFVEYKYDDGHPEPNSNSYVAVGSDCWGIHNEDLLKMIAAVVNGNSIDASGYFRSTTWLQFYAELSQGYTKEVNGVTWHIASGAYWLACTHNTEPIYILNTNADKIEKSVLVRVINIIKETEDSGYIIMGMVTPTVNDQTGAGFFRIPYNLEKKTGSVDVHKYSTNTDITDGNRCYSLAGAKFGIYSDEGCTNEVAELVTDSNGNGTVDELALGTYWVKEKEASKGFMVNESVFTTSITGDDLGYTVEVPETPDNDPVSLILAKKDAEIGNTAQGYGSLGGAQYTVKYYDVDMGTDPAEAGENAKYTWIFETNKDGYIILDEAFRVGGDNLIIDDGICVFPLGTMTFQETKAPRGYLINNTVYVSNTFREAIYVEGKEEPIGYQVRTKNLPVAENAALEDAIKGKIAINKTREIADGSKVKEEGAEFEVYYKTAGSYAAANAWEKDYLVTDKDGYAETKELPYGVYTVHQTKSHEGNTKVKDFDVVVSKNGETYTYNLENPSIKGNIAIEKKREDAEGNMLDEKGAEFEVFLKSAGSYEKAPATARDYITTDSNGYAETKELPYGTYTVHQVKSFPGNRVVADFNVSVSSDETYKYNLENPIVKGKVSINKTREDANYNKVNEAGAEFEVFLKTYGSYANATDNTRDYLTTDANGYAITKELPYGTYTVHQTKSFEGNRVVADFEVVIANGQTYHYNLDNPIIVSKVKVFKKDAVTGRMIAYAGAGFKIIKPDGNVYSYSDNGNVADIFYTDATGSVMIGGVLPYSKGYKLVEVQAPTGYVLDSTPVPFDITKDTMENEDGALVVKVTKNNKPVVGSITIEKTGEVLVSFDGPEEADNKNHFVYAVRKLKGAEFVVYADEDIYSPDYAVDSNGNRVIIYAKDSVVANVVSDESGVAKVENLPLGKYRVVEKKAPATLVLNAKTMYAELAYEGQNQPLVSKSVSLFNERQKVVINAIKKDKNTLEALEGTTIGLFANEDILNADGKVVVKKSQCVEKAVTDKDGKVVFYSDLPLYNFYLQELDPTVGYGTKNEIQYIDATYKGQTVKLQTYSQEFLNERTEIIGTTANDNYTAEHIGSVKEDAIVIDTVEYKNLVVGKTYTIKGILMNKATGKELLDANGKKITAEKTFEAEKEDGSIDIVFKFDASKMQGVTTVAYEYLYQDDIVISTHTDINDEGQTIRFPEIKTELTNPETKNHTGIINDKATLVDKVSYKNLVIGKEYTVSGYLVVKSTGKPLLDKDGKLITGSKTFEAKKADGSVDITFEFDASLIAGETVVAYESIKYYSVELAVHADIEDEDQSVYYPAMRTSASVEGLKVAKPEKSVKLIDTVTYKNLTVGKLYTIKGILMDKATGEALLDANGQSIVAERTFEVKNTDDSIEIEFEFDASEMQGVTTVVFEELYENDIKICEHAEIDDVEQTVHFPEIKTEANSTETKNHTGIASIKETLVDTVTYRNLIVGKEYTVSGYLVVKSTGEALLDENGKKITGSKTFEAEEPDGSVEIVFEYDASLLAGETVVAFESLTYKDIEIAVHADIEDEDQSVYYPAISTSASVGGIKLAQRTSDLTVVDTVTYKNLIIGHSYTIKGILMDKATGNALRDANGKFVRVEKTFEVENADDSIDVEFVFDATGTEFDEIVVFEQLYENDILLATHEDITDVNQTIQFEAPKTGDSNPIGLLIFTMFASLLGMIGIGLLSIRKVTLK